MNTDLLQFYPTATSFNPCRSLVVLQLQMRFRTCAFWILLWGLAWWHVAVSKFFLWHWWQHVLATGMQWVPSPSLPWTLRQAQMLEQGEFCPRFSNMFAANNLLEQRKKTEKVSRHFKVYFHVFPLGKAMSSIMMRYAPIGSCFHSCPPNLGGFSIKSTTTVGSGKDFHIAFLIWSSNWRREKYCKHHHS